MRGVREGVISAPKDSAVCQIVVLKTSYREKKREMKISQKNWISERKKNVKLTLKDQPREESCPKKPNYTHPEPRLSSQV